MPQITYQANKVYIHHWPLDTPKWSNERKEQIDSEINKDKKNKEISISENAIKINNYEFTNIKKIGISIPMFQKQCTMIFEGHCNEFDAHIHITTKEEDYLETCKKLSVWRDKFFPESVR